MRTLTWVPQDLREALLSIDPARDLDEATETPDLATVVGSSVADPVAEHRETRPGRRRWPAVLAPLAVVVAVAAVAAGVLVIRAHGRPERSHVSVGHRHTLPEAAPPPAFPVTGRPRPLVITGETEIISGFASGDSKIAFMDGAVDLAARLPATPRSRDGYPVASAAQAVRRITDAHSCCVAATTRLRIDRVTLQDHVFSTDRGERSLPAWHITFAGIPTDVDILAVAPSALYRSSGSAGSVTVSGHGRRLTFFFVAHRPSAPCIPGSRSTIAVSESSTAVRIAIHTTALRASPPSFGTQGCLSPLIGMGPSAQRPEPGAKDTETVQLTAPLGRRLVVDERDHPYVVLLAR